MHQDDQRADHARDHLPRSRAALTREPAITTTLDRPRALLRAISGRTRDLAAPLVLPDLRRLWGAQVISEFGDWVARIALALLVYERSGSPLMAAAVTTVSLLPWLGAGQLLATLADRYSHRNVMLVSNTYRAVLYLLLAFVHLPLWAVLVLALLAGLGDPPFEAAQSAAMPQLAGERYDQALVLHQVTGQTMSLLGFAAGGVLASLLSPSTALVLNSATFMAAAVVLARLTSTTSHADLADHDAAAPGSTEDLDATESAAARQAAPAGTWALLRAGATALVSDGLVTIGAVVVTAAAIGGIAAESLIAAYADHLGGDAVATGLLATVPPAAAIVSALLLPRRASDAATITAVTVITLALSGLAALAFTLTGLLPAGLWALTAAIAGLAAAGALQTTTVPAGSVIGRRLPRASRASAFSLLQGSLQVTQALAALGAGLLALWAGVPVALAVACLPAALLAAGVLARGVRGAEAHPAA